MNPLPTPYDITALPVFAYTPSIYAWIALGVFVVLAVAVILLALKQQSMRNVGGLKEALNLTLDELARIRARLSRPESDARALTTDASLLARRLLSLVIGQDVSAWSTANCQNHIEERRGTAHSTDAQYQIFSHLITLEQYRYRKASSEEGRNQLNDSLLQLESALRTLCAPPKVEASALEAPQQK